MGNAVEAADDGGDRVEEGVTHPDGENGVLLAETLAGGDAVAIPASDAFPEDELDGAA